MTSTAAQRGSIRPAGLEAVGALVFDTFGTVVDWRSSVADEVTALAGRKGLTVDAEAFADAWRAGLGERYAEEIVTTLEGRGYTGLGSSIEVSHVVTPADWQDAGHAAGTPFASAHTFAQTGPFRPTNLHRHLSNVVFVGSGTQPGVGVPMVLVSGRLAAQRITGAP